MLRYYKHIFSVAGSGFLFFLDQSFKYISRTNPLTSWYIVKPWLGWEYFENTGIAFSLPFPQLVLIGITPLILLWFFVVLKKQAREHPLLLFSLCLIVFGAVSNLIDRILFGVTLDYIRIATAILNIADIMIATGIGILLLEEIYKTKTNKHT